MSNSPDPFDCHHCSSICCTVPPMIHDEPELALAKEYGVRVIAVKMADGKYSCSIVKNAKGFCPFLSKEKGCRIYDNRFKVCHEFSCKAIGKDRNSLFSEPSTDNSFLLNFNEASEPISPTHHFPKETIDAYSIEIVSISEGALLVNATDVSLVLDMLQTLLSKNKAYL